MKKNLVYLIIFAFLVTGTYYIFQRGDSEYQIISTANSGGSINPSGTIQVPSGNDLTLSVSPGDGYEITEILVDAIPIGALTSYTFTNIESDHTIEASFTPIFHVIEASTGTGGSIEPSGSIQVSYGESQLFTFQSEPGYELKELYVDEVSQGTTSSYLFEDIVSDHLIRVEFTLLEPNPSTLTVLWSNPEQVYDMEYSDDGRYLVISHDFEIKYYNTELSSPLWTSANAYEAVNWDLSISGDGDIVAIGDDTGRINYYTNAHQRTGYQSPTWFSTSFGRGLSRDTIDLSENGAILTLGGLDGNLHFFMNCLEKSGANNPEDWSIDTTLNDVKQVKISNDGSYAIIGGHIETPAKTFIQISFIDVTERTELWSYVSSFEGELFDLAISENGYSVTASIKNIENGSIGLVSWNDASRLSTGAEGNPGDPMPSWSYMSPGETRLHMATSGDAGEVTLASMDSILFWRNAETLTSETEPTWIKPLMVSSLAFSMDGETIVASHNSEGAPRISLFDQQGSENTYYEFDANPWLLKVSTDGIRIAAASNGTLWILENIEN